MDCEYWIFAFLLALPRRRRQRPPRFLAYLLATLQTVDEQVGQAVRGALASLPLPPLEWLATVLLNDVAAAPLPCVLVLDDYQAIHAEWVQQFVEFLIDHQPPSFHLVLSTRRDPPLPLPRLRARGQLTELRADDLRFDEAESAAFLAQALGQPLDREQVTALTRRTEGWPAGLQLAALSLRDRPPADVDRFVRDLGSHRHVIDYLADEVLQRQPVEVRDWMRRTSVLDRLCAPLCDALIPNSSSPSQPILEHLERTNLFLVPLDDRREWYRYHRLLVDFLRAELDEASQAVLHGRAMRWFAAHELWPEAVHHALVCGDATAAAPVVACAVHATFRQASFVTLLGWLDVLPDEQVRASSELALYKAFALLFAGWRIADAVQYVEAARQYLPPNPPAATCGRLACLEAHLALYRQDLAVVIRSAQDALRLLDRDDGLFCSLARNILGQALEIQGDIAAAVQVYRQGFHAERRAGNQFGAIVVLTNLALMLNELGQRREAVAVCRQVLEEGAAHPERASALADGACLALSLLSYEADELELARQQVTRALELARQAGISDGLAWAQYILAQVQLAGGEVEAALQTCREARQALGQLDPHAPKQAWFPALEAQVALQRGDLAAAGRWAESAGLTPNDQPLHWDEGSYFVYVRLLLAQRRLEDARTVLSTIERSAEAGRRQRKLITVYLLQARLYRLEGCAAEAEARLSLARSLAEPQGYVRAFVDEGEPVTWAQKDKGRKTEDEQDSSFVFRPSVLPEPLNEREWDILRLIAAGNSNPEIARHLYLALDTVKWHVKNLYGKLGVHNRVEAVSRAQELGLL